MTLHWPQITYLAMVLIGLGIRISKHGKPKTGNENVFYDLIATGIVITLLYFGGFFNQ
jgi:hypothetical protein